MRSPLTLWNGIEHSDRAFIVGSVIAPIFVWWFYYGRQKYGTKGMK
jgi:hypothetical protein